jgi:uncharacterized protein (DUF58 family)
MAAILFVLWVLGVVSGAPVGTWVHLLLAFSLLTAFLAAATTASFPGKQSFRESPSLFRGARRRRRLAVRLPGAGP